jgi:hypothetical protein
LVTFGGTIFLKVSSNVFSSSLQPSLRAASKNRPYCVFYLAPALPFRLLPYGLSVTSCAIGESSPLSCLPLASGSVAARPFEDGFAAHEKGDYATR